jgi:hypothetical protein
LGGFASRGHFDTRVGHAVEPKAWEKYCFMDCFTIVSANSYTNRMTIVMFREEVK